MKKLIITLEQVNRMIVENYYKSLSEEAGKIQKKADFKSVGKNAVNNPDDVKHILDLFSNENVGKAKEVEDIIKNCGKAEASGESPSDILDKMENSEEAIDYTAIGNCADFHKLIADYQKTEVFSSGFNDGKIDPNMDTITNLYTKILGFEVSEKNNYSGNSTPKSLDELGLLAINNIEGGYYHPAMKETLKGGSVMGDSGETLFGLDRKHGGTMNTSSQGMALWNYVDANSGWAEASAGKPKWAYGYTPSDSKLKQYVIDIIKEYYERYMSGGNVSAELKKAVEEDSRLKFHLLYAVWNGIGFFNRFVADLNQYIKSNPNYTKSDLLDVALQSRNNTVLKNKVSNIKQIFNNLTA